MFAADIATRAQREHLTALHGGEVAAWGHKVDAANARARGKAALQGALVGAGMSLLGLASQENWFGGGPPRRQRGLNSFVVPFGT